MDMVRRETRWAFGNSVALGGSGDPSPVTARGLYAATRAVAMKLWDDPDLAGRSFAVQGAGKVGSAYIQLLVENRAEVLVADTYEPATRAAVEKYGVKAVDLETVHQQEVDIFSPCALGAGLNENTIPDLKLPGGCRMCQQPTGKRQGRPATCRSGDSLRTRLRGSTPAVSSTSTTNSTATRRPGPYTGSTPFYDATMTILDTAEEHNINPNEAAVKVAEERIQEIGDLRRFRRSGDDRN